jgi:hypothetical protein
MQYDLSKLDGLFEVDARADLDPGTHNHFVAPDGDALDPGAHNHFVAPEDDVL